VDSWGGDKKAMGFDIGDIVRLRGECGLPRALGGVGLSEVVVGPPDNQMSGCWHEGGPVEHIFWDESYWIRNRKPWGGRRSKEGRETYLRRALEREIELV
jgi:hypothetical protein